MSVATSPVSLCLTFIGTATASHFLTHDAMVGVLETKVHELASQSLFTSHLKHRFRHGLSLRSTGQTRVLRLPVRGTHRRSRVGRLAPFSLTYRLLHENLTLTRPEM